MHKHRLHPCEGNGGSRGLLVHLPEEGAVYLSVATGVMHLLKEAASALSGQTSIH